MAVEYSEIMAAAAMFYSNRELDAYTQDADSLLDWLKDAYKTVSNQAHSEQKQEHTGQIKKWMNILKVGRCQLVRRLI